MILDKICTFKIVHILIFRSKHSTFSPVACFSIFYHRQPHRLSYLVEASDAVLLLQEHLTGCREKPETGREALSMWHERTVKIRRDTTVEEGNPQTQWTKCEGHKYPESQPSSIAGFSCACDLALALCLNLPRCLAEATLALFLFLLPCLPSHSVIQGWCVGSLAQELWFSAPVTFPLAMLSFIHKGPHPNSAWNIALGMFQGKLWRKDWLTW